MSLMALSAPSLRNAAYPAVQSAMRVLPVALPAAYRVLSPLMTSRIQRHLSSQATATVVNEDVDTDVEIAAHYIKGARRVTGAGKLLPVRNPATQELKSFVSCATSSELNEAVDSAKVAFEKWSQTTPMSRARTMMRTVELVRKNMKKFTESITSEAGKTTKEAEQEVIRGLFQLEDAVAVTHYMQGQSLVNISKGVDTFSFRVPLGVCGQISSFNFPLWMPLLSCAMPLALGNTVVLKPSELTPDAPILLAEMFKEAGLPDGAFNVVQGGRETVEGLCDHPDIQAISFIGSSLVGQKVYDRATASGKRAQCNMGAKCHAVLLPDASKASAIDSIVHDAFALAGQKCLAISVAVLVGEAKQWVPDIVAAAKAFKCGAPTDPASDFGAMVTAAAKDRAFILIESGVEQGAKLVLDGRQISVPGHPIGNFLAPTILDGVKPGMRVYDEEIFGPVLSLVHADTLDEAIHILNTNPYGNSCAVFTQSGASASRFQHKINCGQIGINVAVPLSYPCMPFTGNKNSFRGALHFQGREAAEFFTATKSVMSRWD